MSLEIWKSECQKLYDKTRLSKIERQDYPFLGSIITIMRYQPKECSKGSCGVAGDSREFDKKDSNNA